MNLNIRMILDQTIFWRIQIPVRVQKFYKTRLERLLVLGLGCATNDKFYDFLTTAWWLSDNCMTVFWRLTDWWLFYDHLTTAYQQPDDCLTSVWWLIPIIVVEIWVNVMKITYLLPGQTKYALKLHFIKWLTRIKMTDDDKNYRHMIEWFRP